jgi:hypothetical protein
MKLIVEVIGMKAFKGNIDNKDIDSGTIYARVKLDARNNKADGNTANFKVGEAVEEWRMPNAAAILAMKDQKIPFNCALEVERVSNGRETKDVVLSCAAVGSVSAAFEVPSSPVRRAA